MKEANCLRFKSMLGSQTLYEQKEDWKKKTEQGEYTLQSSIFKGAKENRKGGTFWAEPMAQENSGLGSRGRAQQKNIIYPLGSSLLRSLPRKIPKLK